MLVHSAEFSNLQLSGYVVWNCVFPSQDRLFACLGITTFRLLFLSEQSKVNNRMAFSNQPLLELVFDDDAGESVCSLRGAVVSVVAF